MSGKCLDLAEKKAKGVQDLDKLLDVLHHSV